MFVQLDAEMTEMTEAQQHVFALLRTVQYDRFDGSKVVDDLIRWRPLWESVLADWLMYSTGTRFEPVCDLRRLWYLSAGEWMVDTVHILTSGADDTLLRRLIEEHWEGAALHVLTDEEIEWNLNTGFDLPEGRHVYRIWWD